MQAHHYIAKIAAASTHRNSLGPAPITHRHSSHIVRTYVLCVYIAHISETITPVHRKNRGLRPPYIAHIGSRRPPMDNCSWHSSGPAPITHRHSSEIICAYIAHISGTITPVHRKNRGLRPAHIGTHRHYIAVIARGLPMCRWSEHKPWCQLERPPSESSFLNRTVHTF